MTLYGAHVGGHGSSAHELERWMGEQLDGYWTCGEGWDPNNWDRLRPYTATEPGKIGTIGRRLQWSLMFIPDPRSVGEGVEWYRQVARGERNALYEAMGRDLIAYHDKINDTAPIYVRSTWEVPGEWFLWNQAAAADPAAFKAAWKQFATALRAGRPRIKTVWDFNSDRGPIEHLYPGDDVVDVISQDIYWIHDLQGTDPVAAFRHSRHGYSRGLEWHFNWCRQKNKPMAIPEFGIKLTQIDPARLDCAAWFREFFAFCDEVNADPRVGMAYVGWWDDDSANVGKFTTRAPAAQQTAVREMFKARLPGTVLGTTPPPPSPTFPPADITHGTGADSLVLRISQQEYQGSAQYRVVVDGAQFGRIFTASALRSAGQSDTLTLKADWPAGQHQARIEFMNDQYGGNPSADRNLYLDAAAFNGVDIPGARKDLMGLGEAAVFAFTKGTVVVPPPGTDWKAEAERLLAENTALKAQVVTLGLEKAAVAAQNAKLRANAALAVITLNTPI